jgi:hypothetical protein
LAQGPRASRIDLAPTPAGARRMSHVETDMEAVDVHLCHAIDAGFSREQMQTYRLLLEDTLASASTAQRVL